MINKDSRLILEDQKNDFLYHKNKSNLDITFNRIAFIFFIFFFISLIYSIHLIHLGSRQTKIEVKNGIYVSKTISSIDIGIAPLKIINEKKLILNLKYIFPEKNYLEIKRRIKIGKFFYFEKKI